MKSAINHTESTRAHFASMRRDLMSRLDDIFTPDTRDEGDTETESYSHHELANKWGVSPGYVRAVFQHCDVQHIRVQHRRQGKSTRYFCPRSAVDQVRSRFSDKPLMVRRFCKNIGVALKPQKRRSTKKAKSQQNSDADTK